VWQKSHELVLLIYRLTTKFPSEEKFGLTSQIRRAGVSIASNITEGFSRHSRTHRISINFYDIARGSLEEVKYQLLLSKDLKYINTEDYNKAISLSEEVGRTLHSWSSSQK
jgi:four helix bundle protein